MDRLAALTLLERGAAALRRAGMGAVVDRLRGRALRGLGTFTVEVDGIALSGDTAAHSHYVREILDEGREQFLTATFRREVAPGSLVVDVGAHLGLFTVMAAVRGAHVVAFEPNPATLRFLRKNVAANGVEERVEIVEAAATAEPGTRTFFLDTGGDTSSLHRHPGSREMTNVRTVVPDDVLGGRMVDVVKIDVEGAELETLRGLEQTIRRSPAIRLFVECNPGALEIGGASVVALLTRLHELGLEVLELDEAQQRLRPFDGVGDRPYVNLLATRGAT